MVNKKIKWIEVESETIKKITHKNGNLYVVYQRKPECYVYANVSEQKFRKLLAAKSFGTYINKYIKPNHRLLTKVPSKETVSAHA